MNNSSQTNVQEGARGRGRRRRRGHNKIPPCPENEDEYPACPKKRFANELIRFAACKLTCKMPPIQPGAKLKDVINELTTDTGVNQYKDLILNAVKTVIQKKPVNGVKPEDGNKIVKTCIRNAILLKTIGSKKKA